MRTARTPGHGHRRRVRPDTGIAPVALDTGRVDTGRPPDPVDRRPPGGQRTRTGDQWRVRRPDILDGHGHRRLGWPNPARVAARAGKAAVVVELTASCDLTGATEVTSEQPGARRYLRIDHDAPGFSATRAYAFPGGCVTARISAPAASGRQLTTETSSAIGFTTREELRQALSQRSDGRLQLDPGGSSQGR